MRRVARLGLAGALVGGLFLLIGCERPATAPEAPADAAALRIVTLAPHLAEIVASAGAASHLVGVSAYTDHPSALTGLPIVSDGFRVDAEALLAVRPTHVLAWGGGGQASSIALVEQLGLNLVPVDTRSLSDIAPAIRQIGALAGTDAVANAAADAFESEIAALGFEGERLSVFYQIGERPLYTIGGGHFISELLSRCGGDNVFAGLGALAPTVSVEAVVRADPDVIVTAADAGDPSAMWQRWPNLAAVRDNRLLSVPGDLVARPGPRLAAGGRAICETLQSARAIAR